MNCSGRWIANDESIEVGFDRLISSVDPLLSDADDSDVWISSGFIDLQVNGFAGVDYNSPNASPESIDASLFAIFSTGVTRFFPTVITGDPQQMIGALRNLANAREKLPHGHAMEAFHVEGPHISPDDGPRGAHPKQWVRKPDIEEFKRWQEAAGGHVRLVTLAPEWPEAPEYISQLRDRGVVAAIGHTGARTQQIKDAVSAGATLSTHLGNGTHSTLPKINNYIWDQLAEPRLAASFIVDGHHLPDSFLRAALRAKGAEQSILVTDAVAPAMCRPGAYQLGGVDVELKEDDRVVLRGGTRLAGSALRMDRAIANVMRAGATLLEGVAMAAINPARVGRIGGRLRGLQPGDRADLVRFKVVEGRVEIVETILGGESVFTSTGER
jgi:N-acetylglucosamine-6-phosphate deacetylase